MKWKEKSLSTVARPFTEYKPGDVVEIISNSGIRWFWRVVEGMRHWERGWTIVVVQAQNLQGKLHVLREEGFVL